MNVSTTAPAAVEMSILNTRSFRLQMLAKLTGMGMDHLGKGLGAEQKPTAKVLLSAMEQTLLNSVAENIGQIKANAAIREAALRDELDAQRSLNFALAVENSELRVQSDVAEILHDKLDNAGARIRELREQVRELQNRSFWQRLRG